MMSSEEGMGFCIVVGFVKRLYGAKSEGAEIIRLGLEQAVSFPCKRGVSDDVFMQWNAA